MIIGEIVMRSKNLIVCILCSFVILMAIGYAAFAANLKINGTANITSNWDVHIVSINVTNIIEDAMDLPYDETLNPDGTKADKLSATFKSELVSPGDAITYSVVVTNGGTIDAKLNRIDVVKDNNPAILYSINGISENDILAVSDSKTLTITVSYDNNITSQPSILSSRLTLTLDFVQA